MFPDCRFIHIWRNGLEVARSIETMSLHGRWFRPDQYRWNMLAEYAQSMPETAPVPALCQSYYEKGLFEWRVSTQAVTSFLGRLPQDNWLEVSYSAFVADPLETSERLTDFLHLTPEQPVRDFIQQNVRRYSESRDGAELSSSLRTVAPATWRVALARPEQKLKAQSMAADDHCLKPMLSIFRTAN